MRKEVRTAKLVDGGKDGRPGAAAFDGAALAPAVQRFALDGSAAGLALAGWLAEFWSDGARALSLIGRGWLLASVNAGAKC